MDIERALICKIIGTNDLQKAISRGIREDLFADDECRDVYGFIMEHSRKYGGPPSAEALKHEKPKFEWYHVQDTLEWLLEQFVVLVKRRYAQEQVVELARFCDDPSKGAEIDQHFMEVSRKLATLVPTEQVSSFKDMDKRIEEYKERAKEGAIKGVPFGFPKLDEWTKGGIKKHQFVTVAGFTGTGKSTLLKTCAFNAWMSGHTPLYFSLEEDAEEIYERLDAMAAGLNFGDLSHLRLAPEQIAEWEKYAKEMRGKVGDIPVIEGGRSVTPDFIYAEMIRHKPAIVFIDYLSLMKSSTPNPRGGVSMWQSLTEITQDLKHIARTMKIPIFAAAQTNRSGGKDGAELDNIGYSMSVIQDSDISIGLFADDEMKERKEMEIRVNKNRRGRLGKFKAIWDHENLIFRQKDEDDMFKRQKEEDEEKKLEDPKLAKNPFINKHKKRDKK